MLRSGNICKAGRWRKWCFLPSFICSRCWPWHLTLTGQAIPRWWDFISVSRRRHFVGHIQHRSIDHNWSICYHHIWRWNAFKHPIRFADGSPLGHLDQGYWIECYSTHTCKSAKTKWSKVRKVFPFQKFVLAIVEVTTMFSLQYILTV